MERKDCTSHLPHKKNAYTKIKRRAFISHCSLTKNANEEKVQILIKSYQKFTKAATINLKSIERKDLSSQMLCTALND
jgi:hypothetical protein